MNDYQAEYGSRPAHPAELLLSGHLYQDGFVDSFLDEGKRQPRLGAFVFDDYDASDTAQAALRAAIEADERWGLYDRVGDVWFANWPVSVDLWSLPDMSIPIVAWLAPDDDGVRWTLFANQEVRRIARSEWGTVWRAHMDVYVQYEDAPPPTPGLEPTNSVQTPLR